MVPEWCDNNWKNLSPLSEPVGKLMNTTVHVFTDPVLCIGGTCQNYRVEESIGKHVEYFAQSKEYRELHDLAGHPVQLNWRSYPGHTTTKILQEIRKMMAEEQGRIIFTSTFIDIEWSTRENQVKLDRDMVCRFFDQKIKVRSFDARRDDSLAQGAAVKGKGDGKYRSPERKHGGCSQWLSEGQCSKDDWCSFRHDKNQKGKERKREYIQHDLLPETQTDLVVETAKVPKAKDHKVSAHLAKQKASVLQAHAGKLSVPHTKQKMGAHSAKTVLSHRTKTKTVNERSMRRTQDQTRQQPLKH